MKRVIILLLSCLVLNVHSAELADYVPEGPASTIGNGTDLSGVAYGSTQEGLFGEFTVDNYNATLSYPGDKTCNLGGDLEGVTMGQNPGDVYVLNESINGIRGVTVSSSGCTDTNKFKVNLSSSSSDGLEGIVYKDNWLYFIDERTSVIYKAPSDSTGYSVSLTTLFTVPNCFLGSGLTFNGDNLVIACDNQEGNGGNGTLYEYTLDGGYVSELDVDFTNVEGVTFNGSQLIVTGEPNVIQRFSAGDPVDPPPPPPGPTEETCTFSGEVVVNIETGLWDAQTVPFVCPTLTVSGTLN